MTPLDVCIKQIHTLDDICFISKSSTSNTDMNNISTDSNGSLDTESDYFRNNPDQEIPHGKHITNLSNSCEYVLFNSLIGLKPVLIIYFSQWRLA